MYSFSIDPEQIKIAVKELGDYAEQLISYSKVMGEIKNDLGKGFFGVDQVIDSLSRQTYEEAIDVQSLGIVLSSIVQVYIDCEKEIIANCRFGSDATQVTMLQLSTDNENESQDESNPEDDTISILMKKYNLSFEDMEFLKLRCPQLVSVFCNVGSYSPSIEKLVFKEFQRILVSKKVRGDEYSDILIMPQRGAEVEVSLGEDHEPQVQKAVVCHDDVWSVEYTVSDANYKYPPQSHRSTRVLNYVIEAYDTNIGDDKDLLKANFDGFGICYIGAMAEGYGTIGDVVKITLDNGTTFNMVLCDTKYLYHDQKALEPGSITDPWQCQNYWGHGYMTMKQDKVQLCPCEFVAAGDENYGNGKNYDKARSLLSGRYVTEAEIIGFVDLPD